MYKTIITKGSKTGKKFLSNLSPCNPICELFRIIDDGLFGNLRYDNIMYYTYERCIARIHVNCN